MNNGWTWRQYGVFRILFGTYLLVHFVHLLPWGTELFSRQGMLPDATHSPLIGLFPNLLRWFDSPAAVTALLASGAVAAVALIVRRADRLAAVWMWFLLACLFGRNPLIANPSLPVVGWLLLFHALLPARREPWATERPGSAPAPPPLFGFLAWFLLASAYSYSGWTKLFSDAWVQGETVRFVLENPLARDTWLRTAMLATPPWLLQSITIGVLVLELLFAPLALSRRLRPWIWGGMLLVQFGFLTLLNFADLTTPMLLLHLLTFEPDCIRAPSRAPGSTIYYDGECGLCHGWVRFVLAEDRAGAFRFAPLQGASAAEALPEHARRDDYESLVLVTADGRVLDKFAAVRETLVLLGGLWGVGARALDLLPATLGDAGYRLVARNRRRLSRRPTGVCPVMPAAYAARFHT